MQLRSVGSEHSLGEQAPGRPHPNLSWNLKQSNNLQICLEIYWKANIKTELADINVDDIEKSQFWITSIDCFNLEGPKFGEFAIYEDFTVAEF